MSVKARYTNGVFEPLEKVKDVGPGKIYQVFSEDEIRSLAQDLAWLKVAEKSFDFWNNEEDAVYDRL